MTTKQERVSAIFNPFAWQIAPWRDTSSVVLLTGSAGGGKSRLAAEKIHALCLRYPNAQGLMLRKTRQSMTNSTVLFMERVIVGGTGGVVHVASKNRFEYPNRAILAYGGMADDEQRQQVRSIGQAGGVDFVWMEEATAFTEDDYNEVTARMRGQAAPFRQVILTTNPDAPTHWINKRLICGGEARVYYSSASDNLANPAEYIATLGKLTGVLGQRLRDGRWVQAEGAVYEEFDRSIHMIDPFPIPREWRRIRSVDFGYTNPFTCQWWALDGDGRMYLYREMYQTQRLVEDVTEEIKTLSQYENIESTVADHDAEDRATMARHGIATTPARKEITPGIQAVAARLRKAGDGKPRLFIFRNALISEDARLVDAKRPTGTADEFTSYVWPKTQDGRTVKEVPVKDNDHGMDAMRYAVMHVENRSGDYSIYEY